LGNRGELKIGREMEVGGIREERAGEGKWVGVKKKRGSAAGRSDELKRN